MSREPSFGAKKKSLNLWIDIMRGSSQPIPGRAAKKQGQTIIEYTPLPELLPRPTWEKNMGCTLGEKWSFPGKKKKIRVGIEEKERNITRGDNDD